MFGTKVTFSRKKNLQSMFKHTEFEINPFKSDFFIVQPLSPLGFPEPLTPPPPSEFPIPSVVGVWIFSGATQYRFLRSESQNGLIFNLKVANINFPWVLKRSWVEKFGQFPSAEQLLFFH